MKKEDINVIKINYLLWGLIIGIVVMTITFIIIDRQLISIEKDDIIPQEVCENVIEVECEKWISEVPNAQPGSKVEYKEDEFGFVYYRDCYKITKKVCTTQTKVCEEVCEKNRYSVCESKDKHGNAYNLEWDDEFCWYDTNCKQICTIKFKIEEE